MSKSAPDTGQVAESTLGERESDGDVVRTEPGATANASAKKKKRKKKRKKKGQPAAEGSQSQEDVKTVEAQESTGVIHKHPEAATNTENLGKPERPLAIKGAVGNTGGSQQPAKGLGLEKKAKEQPAGCSQCNNRYPTISLLLVKDPHQTRSFLDQQAPLPKRRKRNLSPQQSPAEILAELRKVVESKAGERKIPENAPKGEVTVETTDSAPPQQTKSDTTTDTNSTRKPLGTLQGDAKRAIVIPASSAGAAVEQANASVKGTEQEGAKAGKEAPASDGIMKTATRIKGKQAKPMKKVPATPVPPASPAPPAPVPGAGMKEDRAKDEKRAPAPDGKVHAAAKTKEDPAKKEISAPALPTPPVPVPTPAGKLQKVATKKKVQAESTKEAPTPNKNTSNTKMNKELDGKGVPTPPGAGMKEDPAKDEKRAPAPDGKVHAAAKTKEDPAKKEINAPTPPTPPVPVPTPAGKVQKVATKKQVQAGSMKEAPAPNKNTSDTKMNKELDRKGVPTPSALPGSVGNTRATADGKQVQGKASAEVPAPTTTAKKVQNAAAKNQVRAGRKKDAPAPTPSGNMSNAKLNEDLAKKRVPTPPVPPAPMGDVQTPGNRKQVQAEASEDVPAPPTCAGKVRSSTKKQSQVGAGKEEAAPATAADAKMKEEPGKPKKMVPVPFGKIPAVVRRKQVQDEAKKEVPAPPACAGMVPAAGSAKKPTQVRTRNEDPARRALPTPPPSLNSLLASGLPPALRNLPTILRPFQPNSNLLNPDVFLLAELPTPDLDITWINKAGKEAPLLARTTYVQFWFFARALKVAMVDDITEFSDEFIVKLPHQNPMVRNVAAKCQYAFLLKYKELGRLNPLNVLHARAVIHFLYQLCHGGQLHSPELGEYGKLALPGRGMTMTNFYARYTLTDVRYKLAEDLKVDILTVACLMTEDDRAAYARLILHAQEVVFNRAKANCQGTAPPVIFYILDDVLQEMSKMYRIAATDLPSLTEIKFTFDLRREEKVQDAQNSLAKLCSEVVRKLLDLSGTKSTVLPALWQRVFDEQRKFEDAGTGIQNQPGDDESSDVSTLDQAIERARSECKEGRLCCAAVQILLGGLLLANSLTLRQVEQYTSSPFTLLRAERLASLPDLIQSLDTSDSDPSSAVKGSGNPKPAGVRNAAAMLDQVATVFNGLASLDCDKVETDRKIVSFRYKMTMEEAERVCTQCDKHKGRENQGRQHPDDDAERRQPQRPVGSSSRE